MFDSELSGNPSLVYSTPLGGFSDDYDLGVAVRTDSLDQVHAFVAGYTGSSNFFTTAGAYGHSGAVHPMPLVQYLFRWACRRPPGFPGLREEAVAAPTREV